MICAKENIGFGFRGWMLIIFPDPSPAFIFVGISGAVSVVLLLIFKPDNVKALDNKYRAAAGNPLDDALAGRK